VSGRLKLSAVDREDLQVIAALLQDALVAVVDMRFLPEEKSFVLVANRFRWENCKDTPEAALDPGLVDCSAYERVNCGLAFLGVERVRRRALDMNDRARILELLDLESEPGALTLVFAGGAAIRLEGDNVTCRLGDVGEPWPTPWRPKHPVGDQP
jgi:hypothetical protein